MTLYGNHSRQAWAPSRLLVLVRRAHGVAVAVRLFCDNEKRAAPQPVAVSRVSHSR